MTIAQLSKLLTKYPQANEFQFEFQDAESDITRTLYLDSIEDFIDEETTQLNFKEVD
jgi:hypothetical protein